MDQDKTFLGTEPVGKLLLKLAVPTVIAQLVNMLYNIVDRIYIGHMPGDGSLADRHRRMHADHTRRVGLCVLLRDRRRAARVDIHGARRP